MTCTRTGIFPCRKSLVLGHHIDAKTYIHLWFENEPVRPKCPVCSAELDLNGIFFNRWLQQVIQIAPDDAMLKISPDGLAFVSDRHINEPLVVIPEEVGVDCSFFMI